MKEIISRLNLLQNVDSLSDHLGELDTEYATFFEQYRPQLHFIIYGTLAPGKPNHHIVAPIEGVWEKGCIRGRLVSKGWGAAMGFNAFEEDHQGDIIEAYVLVSESLPEHWPMLDDFEGEGYRRILATYQLDDGRTGVGYIYSSRENE